MKPAVQKVAPKHQGRPRCTETRGSPKGLLATWPSRLGAHAAVLEGEDFEPAADRRGFLGLMRDICPWVKINQGGPQILVHVSMCQGSILGT